MLKKDSRANPPHSPFVTALIRTPVTPSSKTRISGPQQTHPYRRSKKRVERGKYAELPLAKYNDIKID